MGGAPVRRKPAWDDHFVIRMCLRIGCAAAGAGAAAPETRVDIQCPCGFTRALVNAADRVTQAAMAQVPIEHPDDPGLAVRYGTALTGGRDPHEGAPSAFLPSNLRGPAMQA